MVKKGEKHARVKGGRVLGFVELIRKRAQIYPVHWGWRGTEGHKYFRGRSVGTPYLKKGKKPYIAL